MDLVMVRHNNELSYNWLWRVILKVVNCTEQSLSKGTPGVSKFFLECATKIGLMAYSIKKC